jgi:hypothetical protein
LQCYEPIQLDKPLPKDNMAIGKPETAYRTVTKWIKMAGLFRNGTEEVLLLHAFILV